MKIGMLTGLWYVSESAPLLESLRRCARLGFRYIDLHGVFHAGPAHLDANDRRCVKAELEALGLQPRNYVLHAPVNPAAASDAEQVQNLDYLSQGIDLASYWGIHQLMLNAGQWSHGIPRRHAWQRSVKFIQQVCDYAETKDVFIAQEPEPYVWFLVQDLNSAARMAQDVDRPNFTLLVDLGHMGLSREGPEELLAVKDTIVHAHFSDHQTNLHTNQVIGTGVTPTSEYLEWLREIEIDRLVGRFGCEELVISFELGVPGDRIEDPDDWARRSIEFVRENAPWMTLN